MAKIQINMGIDIFGNAMLDYLQKKNDENIITYSSVAEQDTIPVPYLFRNYKSMPKIEQKALQLCKGKVLDIGCGAGSHSVHLQNKNLEVTALDASKGAIEVCKKRGIKKTICSDVLNFDGQKFDTLLLLMNGIGIVGKLKNLETYLSHLKTLLNPNGQILLDSSDIIYMFDEDDDGGYWIPTDKDYYGEVDFQMEYKGEKSSEFPWLYLDYNTLQNAANYNGFKCEMITKGEHYDYLAKLSL